MILIFGGTTEGRMAVNVCDEAHKDYFYSTKGDSQKIDLAHGIRITGALDSDALKEFCTANAIQLVVDAAHPFAENLHKNIARVTDELQIPVLRYERQYPDEDNDILWFDSYQEAMQYLTSNKIDNLLALTGVNTIAKLKPYWENHNTWFRILDRAESRAIITQMEYPFDRVLYYKQGEDEMPLFEQLKPQAIITKESGESGGFMEKVAAAKALNIPMLVVRRPALSPNFISVYGQYGLRKQIETLVPDFFELKTGYTTGSCATAATKAALTALVSGDKVQKVSITLPSGEQIFIPIASITIEKECASATVLKDAGDDPDVTHGKEIVSTVQLNTEHKGIKFLQGKGVGTITLPGLDIPIGEPAINKTPRMMMKREVYKVFRHHEDRLPNGLKTGVDITISVPDGEELALKTFNPRLGIVNGISIIGTSGIVKPFSSDAFIASIRREMQVAKALGSSHIVINSGAKSEKYVKQLYPDLISNSFVHYGNFIGEAIKIAADLDMKKLTMGIMLGKAVKLAEGSLDTHSKKVVMNKAFLAEVAQEANCSQSTIDAIENITMARQLWEIIPPTESKFFAIIRQKCEEVCLPLFSNGELEVLLIDDEGNVVR